MSLCRFSFSNVLSVDFVKHVIKYQSYICHPNYQLQKQCSVKQGVLKDNFLQNTSGWSLLELTLQKHYSWYRRFHIHWLSFFLNILFVLTHNFRIQEMCHKKIGCQIYLLWWLTPRQTRSRYSRKKTYACPSHVFQGH